MDHGIPVVGPWEGPVEVVPVFDWVISESKLPKHGGDILEETLELLHVYHCPIGYLDLVHLLPYGHDSFIRVDLVVEATLGVGSNQEIFWKRVIGSLTV